MPKKQFQRTGAPSVLSAISRTISVCVMPIFPWAVVLIEFCFAFSLIVLHVTTLPANLLKFVCVNLRFAFFCQFFFTQPFVQTAFHTCSETT